jgi:hypothetical protein
MPDARQVHGRHNFDQRLHQVFDDVRERTAAGLSRHSPHLRRIHEQLNAAIGRRCCALCAIANCLEHVSVLLT